MVSAKRATPAARFKAVYLPGLAMRPQEHQSTTEGNTQ